MKKLFFLALTALTMIACADKNAPDNEGETASNEFLCDPSFLEFDFATTSSKTITVQASSEWSATTNVSWVSIEPKNGLGDAFVKVTCEAGDPAESKIIFSTGKASATVIVHRVDNNPDGYWVSPTKQIKFSTGNLQYQPSTNTWRFAEHQFDTIGVWTNMEEMGSSSYSGWIDLFAWGTSGYIRKPNELYDYTVARDPSGFGHGLSFDIAGTNYDWGQFNKISNGGNIAGLWRTLTEDEYFYLVSKRPNASKLYKQMVYVNGMEGVMLLPHGWEYPEGLSTTARNEYKYNDEEWSKMEKSGAVFLPNTGYCWFEKIKDWPTQWEKHYMMNWWFYWSSSRLDWKTGEAYIYRGTSYNQNYYGAVRLVQDVE